VKANHVLLIEFWSKLQKLNLLWLGPQRHKKFGAIAGLLSRNVNVDKLKLPQGVTHGRSLHASCCIISKNDRRFLINLYPADHTVCTLNTIECRSYPLGGARVWRSFSRICRANIPPSKPRVEFL